MAVPDDIALRNLTYRRFAELGRAATAAEIAAVAGLDEAEVMTGWERLHAEHCGGDGGGFLVFLDRDDGPDLVVALGTVKST